MSARCRRVSVASDVGCRDYTIGMEVHQQFARHGVSTAELLGSVGAHVAAADRRGEAQHFLEVLAQPHMTTDVDECVRSDLVVDDDRRARMSSKAPALD